MVGVYGSRKIRYKVVDGFTISNTYIILSSTFRLQIDVSGLVVISIIEAGQTEDIFVEETEPQFFIMKRL